MSLKRYFGGESERRDLGNQIPIEIIDESSSDNILSDPNRQLNLIYSLLSTVYSEEGFAENRDAQASLAIFLKDRFKIKDKGDLLDVGFGANTIILDNLQQSGISACGLEFNKTNPKKHLSQWHGPTLEEQTPAGARVYSGDIGELAGKDSELKDKKFGLILFNGSWLSSGNNWTVAGEILDGKFYENAGEKDKNSKTARVEYMDKEKDHILQTCAEHLKEGGLMGFVSSRYAFHGAGYSFDHLPEEKLEFLDLCRRLAALGAKRLYLVGLSQSGWQHLVESSWKKAIAEFKPDPVTEPDAIAFSPQLFKQVEVKSVQRQVADVNALLPENVFTRIGDNNSQARQRIFNQRALAFAKQRPEMAQVARIDAVIAEF